jgi:hypothetical protein
VRRALMRSLAQTEYSYWPSQKQGAGTLASEEGMNSSPELAVQVVAGLAPHSPVHFVGQESVAAEYLAAFQTVPAENTPGVGHKDLEAA